MELQELEKRLNAINDEESNKIQKVCESYRNSKKVIEQLMEEQLLGGSTVLEQSLEEEEEDLDQSMYIHFCRSLLNFL